MLNKVKLKRLTYQVGRVPRVLREVVGPVAPLTTRGSIRFEADFEIFKGVVATVKPTSAVRA